MDLHIKTKFLEKWEQYFPNCELPVACFYSDNIDGIEFPKSLNPSKIGHNCIFSQLIVVRKGKPRAFNQENLGCFGAARLFGFIPPRPVEEMVDLLVDMEKFKKGYEHVKGIFQENSPLKAQGKYLVFKPWDTLTEDDVPEVIFFFVNADALSGLHSLANFDTVDSHGVISPFGSGCDSLVGFSMKEMASDAPRAVVGLFDPAARECVKKDLLNFSVPWPKFLSMLENMDTSFLKTPIWEGIKKRLSKEV
ncbi:MAG: DUF169 domain-containing protein [Desulfobacteraceae bacterium]|nr:DUF169 domain-containing protein [Desulfobacteraceae bacterium]